MKLIIGSILGVVVAVMGYLGLHTPLEPRVEDIELQLPAIEEKLSPLQGEIREMWASIEDNLGAAVQLFAGSTYNLSGSGVSSTATSITLTSLTLPQNDYEIQDSDLSETFYITLEPGSKTKQEIVSCTTVAQSASNDTATLSGCTRGLSPLTPYTASTTLRFAHAGGTTVIFSDPPQIFEQLATRNNEESITHTWTFDADNPPQLDEASKLATTTTQFVSKEYVDATVNQGSATSTGVVGGILELATSLEAASTTNLGANRPLALHTLLSSSGCTSATSSVVVTRTDGRIDTNCMATTTPYFFSAVNIKSNTTTGTSSIFKIRDTGTSTPTLLVNNRGYVGIGTSTPASELAVNGTSTMTGFFMTTQASKGRVLTSGGTGVGTWQLSYTLVSTTTSESSTNATSDADITRITGLSIDANTPIMITGMMRRNADGEAATLGIELNSSKVASTTWSTTNSDAESGMFEFYVPSRNSNYPWACKLDTWSNSPAAGSKTVSTSCLHTLPTATVTTITIFGRVTTNAVMSVSDVRVYTLPK